MMDSVDRCSPTVTRRNASKCCPKEQDVKQPPPVLFQNCYGRYHHDHDEAVTDKSTPPGCLWPWLAALSSAKDETNLFIPRNTTKRPSLTRVVGTTTTTTTWKDLVKSSSSSEGAVSMSWSTPRRRKPFDWSFSRSSSNSSVPDYVESFDCCSESSESEPVVDHLLVLSDDAPPPSKSILLQETNEPSQPTTSNTASIEKHSIQADRRSNDKGREMTKLQEKWNAISMVPPSIYCLWFIWTKCWIQQHSLELDLAAEENNVHDALHNISSFFPTTSLDFCVNDDSVWWSFLCEGQQQPQQLWPTFLPPLPAMSIIWGVWLHLPFSFVYHWEYAHQLHGTEHHVSHWSKRWDQAAIHTSSSLFAFGSSGNVLYFAATVLFNGYFVCRHVMVPTTTSSPPPPPHDASNKAWTSLLNNNNNNNNNSRLMSSFQIRLGILLAILSYVFPVLAHEYTEHFVWLCCTVGLALWLFACYPLEGWSHVGFHVAIGLVPSLLLYVACKIPIS